MKYKIRCVGSSFLLATALSLPTNSIAQDQQDSALEEIIVTGLKRSASILTTPAAISALGAEELVAKGIDDPSDIQYLVPSLHYGESLGRRNISIRGIGEFQYAPGVLVSIDGIVQAVGTSSQLTQLDLERIEVLRGPQGTLYGRNANGGAVNYLSNKPTEEMQGHIKVGFAEYDQYSIEGVYSGPISDRVGIRIAASYLDANEGWIENLQPGQDDLMQGEKLNLRLILAAELSDSLDAELIYGRSEMSGPWDHWAAIRENFDIGVANGLPADNVMFTLEPRKIYSNGLADSEREYELIGLTLNWEFDGFTIKSITGYQDWKDNFFTSADGTSLGLFQREDTATNESLTQEFNIAGETERLNWIAGFYYLDDDRSQRLFFDFPLPAFGFPGAPIIDIQSPFYKTETMAAFVDATFSVTDSFRIGAGVRRTEEDKEEGHTSSFFAQFPGMDPFFLFAPCGQDLLIQEWSENSNTIRASLEYDLTDNSMMYVSYSEGFKVGGINQSECNPEFDPETVDAYEIGYKASYFDGATTLTAAVFHYDYADFQTQQVIGLQGAIANAGDAEIDGLEVEIASQLNSNWSINGGFTLLDSEYIDFLNTDTLQQELGVQQNKGNPLNNAPETAINLGLSYNTPLNVGGSLAVAVNAAYRSRTYFREFNNEADSQPGYTVVNFNMNWKSDDRLYAARLFVNNLTDEEYVTNLVASNTTYARQGTWNMPRQVGIELTRFFGAR